MKKTKELSLNNSDITVKDKRLANLKPFSKGISGNPKGRPKAELSIDDLLKAVKDVEKLKGKTILEKFVESAYTNPQIMIALIDRFIPKQIKTEAEVKHSYSESYDNLSDEELINNVEQRIIRIRPFFSDPDIN